MAGGKLNGTIHQYGKDNKNNDLKLKQEKGKYKVEGGTDKCHCCRNKTKSKDLFLHLDDCEEKAAKKAQSIKNKNGPAPAPAPAEKPYLDPKLLPKPKK